MGLNPNGGSKIAVFRYRDHDDSEARDTIFLETAKRNANIYTAEIKPGIPIGSPQPFKEL